MSRMLARKFVPGYCVLCIAIGLCFSRCAERAEHGRLQLESHHQVMFSLSQV